MGHGGATSLVCCLVGCVSLGYQQVRCARGSFASYCLALAIPRFCVDIPPTPLLFLSVLLRYCNGVLLLPRRLYCRRHFSFDTHQTL